jgi:hypothetical protein
LQGCIDSGAHDIHRSSAGFPQRPFGAADGRRAVSHEAGIARSPSGPSALRPALDSGPGSGHDRGIVRFWQRGGSAGVWVSGMCAVMVALPAVAVARQAVSAASAAPVAPNASWFRVFLLDGQILSVVGEFSRVDDLVMLQVPIGPPAASGMPEARTVTIAASAIDWARTEANRQAQRRAQFERAGGARAYAAFTEEVAATLRDVAVLPDPAERIRRLEAARVQLAQWPAAHHGDRADEVAQTLSVVDDLLNGMRAAAGQQAFTLALSTTPAPAPMPTPPPLPTPTLQDVVTQALGLAPRVADAGERLLLLQSAEAMLMSPSDLDRRWARSTLGQVRRQIKTERTVTRRYEQLRAWMLDKATRLLAVADVRGLMRVREEVVSRDARLKQQRPAEVTSLLATLDMRLDQARRQRLLLERWTERQPALKAYTAVLGPHLSATAALPRALEEVKALSGPQLALLAQAESQLANARAHTGVAVVPDEARGSQQVWLSAQQLAARALQARRAAIRSGNLQQAWEASAAAAGALMLLQQLRTDLPRLLDPPALPTLATPRP